MEASSPRADNPPLGILLMCAGVALFALGEGCVKALSRDHEIAQVVWARYVFHALVFLLVFSRGGVLRQIATRRPVLHLARSAALLAGTVTFFTALKYLSLPEAAAINFVTPLLVTALSIPFLGEKVGIRRWTAIMAGLAGVLVVIRPGFGIAHWAAVLPLATAACYAAYQIMTRVAGRSEDTRTSLFWTSAVGVVVMSCAAPFFWTAPAAAAWALMAATGTLFGLGHYLLIRAFEVAEASTVSPFLYTQIVWVTAVSVAAFGEVPDAWTLAGAAIIIGSGLYVWSRERRLARPRAT